MKITKGKWEILGDGFEGYNVIADNRYIGEFRKKEHSVLAADAGNTYQSTKKLPSELAEANKELLEALTRLYDAIDSCVELTPELLHTCIKIIHKNSKNA